MKNKKPVLRLLSAMGLVSAVTAPAYAVTVDLLVVYDSYTNSYFQNQTATAMQSWVNQMNVINQNSQVDVQWRLVGAVQHEVSGNDMGQQLGNLRVDGWVTQTRDQVGADFVTLISQKGACGVGYMAVDKNWSFNVVGPNCGPNAMAHELGHNMGLAHSRRQGDQGGLRYGYGLGYGVDGKFGTIMTYESLFNAPKVAKYSNPRISCSGIPCGINEGQPDQADAAKAINNVRYEISGFFPTKITGAGGDTLSAGQCINAGQSLASPDGRHRLSMQTDGNLVIYNLSSPTWASGTWQSGANRLCMQTDGNLVVYAPSGPRWASNTWKSSANRVTMQDDGNLVMYGPYGAVWASGTMGR